VLCLSLAWDSSKLYREIVAMIFYLDPALVLFVYLEAFLDYCFTVAPFYA